MTLDRQTVKELRDKLQTVLEGFQDSYDLTVGNASFNEDEVTFKLNLRLKGAETKEQKDLKTFAVYDNIDINKTVDFQGNKWNLVGFNRNARKRPYLVKNLNSNKKFVFETQLAKRLFGKEVA
tara:strand:+ start:665 stop:1033 length:369 start_codon:yes stop_codon:yes gene_type:complete